jgi:hypothetical protein
MGMQSSQGASVASLNELQDFIFRLFAFDLPKNFFIQMAVAGTVICILVILGGATIASRILQRSFWVFKVTRRSEGLYLVPNALNTFLVFEAVFAFVWLAFIIVQYHGYWLKDGSVQRHIATLNLIVWWPLWIGAFMAAWGSFYTAPGALDKGNFGSNRLSRLMPKPAVINAFCVGTPFVLIVSLIPLMVLAQSHLNDAFSAYKALAADIQTLVSAAGSTTMAATPEQASALLSRASAIWDMQVKTGYYLSIGYSIWPVYAGVFLIFYIPAGGYLVYMVYKQLRRQRATLESLRQKYVDDDAARAAAAPGLSVPAAARTQSKRDAPMRQIISLGETGSRLPEPPSSLLFQPLSPNRAHPTTETNNVTPPITPSTIATGKDSYKRSTSCSPQYQPQALSKGDGSTEGEVFFPALKPEIHKRATAAARRLSSVGGTPYSRYKYLRRCLINLSIIYVAIVCGAALYLGVSASLGGSLHSAYIKGPEHVAKTVYGACVATAWGAVLFGSLCVFAIMARLIDPANAGGSTTRGADSESKPGATNPLRYISNTIKQATGRSAATEHGASPSSRAAPFAAQDKSRAMPAVPESVGATFDEMMSGQSFPVSAAHHRGGGLDSQLQSFMFQNGGQTSIPNRFSSIGGGIDPTQSLTGASEEILAPSRSTTMKFDIHARPGHGLILEPNFDPTASTMSYGFPESQTASMDDGSMQFHGLSPRTGVPMYATRRSSAPRVGRRSSAGRKAAPHHDWDMGGEDVVETIEEQNLPVRELLAAPTTPTRPLVPARTPPLSPVYLDASDDIHEDGGLTADELADNTASTYSSVQTSPVVPTRFAAQNARAQMRKPPVHSPIVTSPRRQSLQH